MKTLILNGSPRRSGETVALINRLTQKLEGEIMTVDCYRADISPCVDCRKCRERLECSLKDDMQSVYEFISVCDNVVVASPLYFGELTGKLLDVASRLQMYFSARFFRHEQPQIMSKKGAVILVGGGSGNADKAYDTALVLLHSVNTEKVFPLVCSHNTDKIPVADDIAVLEQIDELANFLNLRC